jgi:hypothetical protein
MAEDTTRDNNANKIEAVKTLFQLWSDENNLKTQKLTLFFTAQSILVSAYTLRTGKQYLIPIIGMVFSFVWFFSIGRTVAFQKIWKTKIDRTLRDTPELIRNAFDFYPTSEDKMKVPFYGKMSAKYILLWPPAVGLLLWLGILIYVVLF